MFSKMGAEKRDRGSDVFLLDESNKNRRGSGGLGGLDGEEG